MGSTTSTFFSLVLVFPGVELQVQMRRYMQDGLSRLLVYIGFAAVTASSDQTENGME